ncbi:CdvA-like protein [Candidatus Bathyarchaeota archaeon]|nr:CdvA-like protein [Candidatus Bathyarchaeota archaeon]
MISWKYSFEKISEDLELAKKKKQALDNLYNSGRISASTYGSLDNDLSAVISDIEMRQKILSDNLTSKVNDLEKQIGTLEIFLANSEIQYVAGEIGKELHTNETAAFSNGLNSLKSQLISIKEAVATIIPENASSVPPSISDAEPLQLADVVFEETAEVVIDSTDDISTEAEVDIAETPSEVPIAVTEDAVAETPVYTPIEIPEVAIEDTVETPVEEAVEVSEVAQTPIENTSEIPEVAVQGPVEALVEETLTPYVEISTEEKILEPAVNESSEDLSAESPEVPDISDVMVEETVGETSFEIPEVAIENTIETPVEEAVDFSEAPIDDVNEVSEVPVDVPEVIVEEAVEDIISPSVEVPVEEEILEVPVEGLNQVESTFDELTEDKPIDSSIPEVVNEAVEVIPEQKTEIPITEEITTVEIISEAPVEEVIIEEEIIAEEVFENSDVSEEITDSVSEEVPIDEVSDDEELTIEDANDCD